MRKKISFLTACLAVTALFTACKKNGEAGGTPEPSGGYTTMEALYQTQTTLPFSISVNSALAATFFGNSGTRYMIPDSAFTQMDGTPVTGTVTLQVKEYLSKKDMMFHRVLPLTDTSVLAGRGIIYIQAFKSGTPLQLAAGKMITAYMPQGATAELPTGLKLFLGNARVDSSYSKLSWKAALPDAGNIDVFGDSVVLATARLGYSQAADYMPGPVRKVTLNLSGFPDFGEAAMLRTYVLYNNFKSTYGMGQSPFGYRNGATVVDSFVANAPLHFISFGIKDGFFYGGIREVTISSDSTLSLELHRMEAVDLFSQVGALR